MTASILLHIGINETGAPDIQQWLTENHAALLKRGLLYPVTGRTSHSHDALASIATPRISERDENRLEVDVSGLLSLRDQLRQEITISGASHVVISSTDLAWLTDLNPVQDIFRKMQVRVVIYLRRHDVWWEHVYRQLLVDQCAASAPFTASGPEQGLLPFVLFKRATEPTFGNYLLLVQRWAAAFGKENIIVHPYEIKRESSNVASFLQAADLVNFASGLEINPDSEPTPMPRHQLQLLDAFLRANTSAEVRQRLVQHATTEIHERDSTIFHLPAERRSGIINWYLKSYALIAREFLGRQDGHLFAQRWPSATEPWEPPRTLTTVECIEETIKALTAVDAQKAKRPSLISRLLRPD